MADNFVSPLPPPPPPPSPPLPLIPPVVAPKERVLQGEKLSGGVSYTALGGIVGEGTGGRRWGGGGRGGGEHIMNGRRRYDH